MLIVGAGVVGTVYGVQLAAAGHSVAVLAHGERTDVISGYGLVARDALTKTELASPVLVVDTASSAAYDLIVVTVRYGQLTSTATALANLPGQPLLLYFGNTPSRWRNLPLGCAGSARLGFPGIGGSLENGVVDYARIAQQPTALEACPSLVLDELDQTLRERGFKTQRVTDMEGWLAYHAVFIASVTSALYQCGTDARQLAGDRQMLWLMCRAIGEGFAALRSENVGGAPAGLAFLHRAAIRPFAASYWARMLRTPMGELYFAAHARHAPDEMRAIAIAALARVGRQPAPQLHRLVDV